MESFKEIFYKQVLRTPLAQRAIRKFVKHEQANHFPSYYAYIDERKTLIAPVSGDCKSKNTASGRPSAQKDEMPRITGPANGIGPQPSVQEDPDLNSPTRH